MRIWWHANQLINSKYLQRFPEPSKWSLSLVHGYTIMGKTADLTVVQKTIIDTLHKEGKPQTFIAKEAGCSQSAVSKHVNRKLSRRKTFGRKRCTAPVYQNILEQFMLPSADQLFKDADFIFQQDLAPAHTTKSIKSWLNDHGVGVLDWPANSPDLNPIDNLYCQEENEKQETKRDHADELKATVKETWASTPPQQCHKLITSMSRRIEAVIKAKGAPTMYWVHIQ